MSFLRFIHKQYITRIFFSHAYGYGLAGSEEFARRCALQRSYLAAHHVRIWTVQSLIQDWAVVRFPSKAEFARVHLRVQRLLVTMPK